jgi:hypothetical protein
MKDNGSPADDLGMWNSAPKVFRTVTWPGSEGEESVKRESFSE